MEPGFGFVLGVAVIGSLLWIVLSWRLLERRIRRNRAGKCAHCSEALTDARVRIKGLTLCATCARRSQRVVTLSVRAIGLSVLVGSAAMLWAVQRVWGADRRGAWLMLGLWALAAAMLLFLAFLSARGVRDGG